MRAVVVNCILEPAPAPTNTGAPADLVADELHGRGVTVETYRAVDQNIPPGVQTDMGGR